MATAPESPPTVIFPELFAECPSCPVALLQIDAYKNSFAGFPTTRLNSIDLACNEIGKKVFMETAVDAIVLFPDGPFRDGGNTRVRTGITKKDYNRREVDCPGVSAQDNRGVTVCDHNRATPQSPSISGPGSGDGASE